MLLQKPRASSRSQSTMPDRLKRWHVQPRALKTKMHLRFNTAITSGIRAVAPIAHRRLRSAERGGTKVSNRNVRVCLIEDISGLIGPCQRIACVLLRSSRRPVPLRGYRCRFHSHAHSQLRTRDRRGRSPLLHGLAGVSPRLHPTRQ
jgi:hypothetical protein